MAIKTTTLFIFLATLTFQINVQGNEIRRGAVMGCGSAETLDLEKMKMAIRDDGLVMSDHFDGFQTASGYSYISIRKVDIANKVLTINPELKIDAASFRMQDGIIGIRSAFASYINLKVPDKGVEVEPGIYEFNLPLRFISDGIVEYKGNVRHEIKDDSIYYYSGILGADLRNNIETLKVHCDYKLRLPIFSETKELTAEFIEDCRKTQSSAPLNCFLR